MKKCVIVLFVLALVFASSYASAEGLYAKGIIGATFPTDQTLTPSGVELDFDTGYLLGVAVGSDLGNNVRVEGEIAYNKSDVNKASGAASPGDVKVWSFLVNCYYDIQTGSPVTPFIGAGIGAANVKLYDGSVDPDDTVFAYQASAGIGYAVSDSATI